MSEEAERARLLEAMASLGPGDDSTFLMPRASKRLLDPGTVVVIGARGSGKSALGGWCETAAFRSTASPGRATAHQGTRRHRPQHAP
jgi:uncharacterized ferredoxin-like protein